MRQNTEKESSEKELHGLAKEWKSTDKLAIF
jgi:hypothetical protein